MNKIATTLFAVAALATVGFSTPVQGSSSAPQMAMAKTMAPMTGTFKGVEVNGGTAGFAVKNGKRTLSLSSDFQVPNTPAPHWQVVDSKGNVYLLNQLKIAGNKKNLSVTIPAYVKDVAKVQIWCSFAEVVLGEANFDRPVK